MNRLVILLLPMLLLACSKEEKSQIQQTSDTQIEKPLKLVDEIVRTPASIVGITAFLDLEFRDPVVPAHMQDVVLDQNPFEFEPAIPGHAKWMSQRILRYIPDQHLPAGQKIMGTLHGKIAFGEQRQVDDFTFTFKVAEQEILALEGDFEPAEGQNMVRYSGLLTFAQAVNLEQVRQDIDFRGPNGKLPFSLKQESGEGIRITSEAVTRTSKGQNFKIALPAKYRAGDDAWEEQLFLPGIDVFRVMAHMDASAPDGDQQVYAFRFSDEIKTNFDLSGYVTVTPEVPFSVRISGKRLLIQGNFGTGEEYEIKIAQGFPSSFGTALADDYTATFSFDNLKPQIVWLSPGVYLPTDNQFKLQLKSVNVRRVQIEVFEIYPKNIGFFVQTNALIDIGEKYNNLYGSPRYQDLERVGKSIYKEQVELTLIKNQWHRTELNLSPVFVNKKNSAFVVNLTFTSDDLVGSCVNDRNRLADGDLFFDRGNYYDNPCSEGYYYSRGYLTRLLISSDIGLTMKNADDGCHLFAMNVLTARPAGNLALNLYNYQNQLLESQTTDSDGYARFASKEGTYVMSTDNSGIAILKTDHPAWELNNFDVAGSSGGVQGTDVFMYAERGVHRPGDTIHFSAIIRMSRAAPPEKAPVLLKVSNPKGQVVYEGRTSAGPDGHVYFPIETESSDPTGDWRAELSVGDHKFYQTLKVETVKPNRLKIEVDVPQKLTATAGILTGTITARYLFGAPAANLRTNIRLAMSEEAFRSPDYPDFLFTSPVRQYVYRSHTIYEGNLNAEGVYQLNYALPSFKQAPSLVSAMLHTTVYEKGGSFVERQTPLTIYPYSAYAGIKDIFQDDRARVGQSYDIPIIVLDDDGKPVSGHKLTVRVYHNRNYWWWDYNQRDQRDYRRMQDTHLLEEFSYTSQSKPISHRIEIEDYGNHLIEVTDETSGHATGLFFWTSYWGGQKQVQTEERNYLDIVSNKNVYAVGDQAAVSFDTPSEGTALLTVEQGSRIIRRKWQRVKGGQTSFSFPVTQDLVPNCYVSVSLVQPHNQNTNDLPMRLYGIKTLYVEEPSTHLPLTMQAPDELQPKQPFTVSLTSNSPARASYTIAIVDDGLLDLTDFETPDPWEHYFKKLRLGVQTRDNYDDIIGILYPDMDKYFSIGGDLDEQRRKRTETNEIRRFKPVVLFQGPVTIKPGETKTTRFTMPNYVGSVRIMVVAGGGHSYTALDKTIPVKQPLMILTTVPRVARPGDHFAVPVSVFAMDSTISDVRLSLTTSPNLKPAGDQNITVPFQKTGEKDVAFSVAVGSRVGPDSLTVVAEDGRAHADHTVHLPVSSANPFYTDVRDTMLTKGQSWTVVPRKIGIAGTNRARIAFSRMPDIQLDRRLRFLIRYPYGCIEQTTSAAFPQLYLTFLQDLGAGAKQEITENINAAISRLNRFKMQGGFSYWPGTNFDRREYSDWGTSYAGHFLVEARALGYHVPDDLFNHWLQSASSRAKTVDKENHRYQTYRLFVLSLAGKPDIGAMNLVRENYLGELDPLSRKLLAAAYYLGNLKDVANEIDSRGPAALPDYRELGGTYGSTLRDRALMPYLCLKMQDLNTAGRLLGELIKAVNRHYWCSTQETAMALLALGTYGKQSPFVGGSVKFDMKVAEQRATEMTLDNFQTIMDLDAYWDSKIKITQKNDNPLFVTLLVEGVPLESKVETENHGILLYRNFYDEQGQPVPVSQRTQGKSFWVVYTIQNQYAAELEELALTSIFPAGWEIVNTRLTGEQLPPWLQSKLRGSAEYMDIRDDRINWFFDLRYSSQVVFAAKINPTFKGTFTLPPVSCEAMYSPEFFARIAGGKVVVN